jgi:hypothetical protein
MTGKTTIQAETERVYYLRFPNGEALRISQDSLGTIEVERINKDGIISVAESKRFAVGGEVVRPFSDAVQPYKRGDCECGRKNVLLHNDLRCARCELKEGQQAPSSQ